MSADTLSVTDMARRNSLIPRPIQPELIMSGDTIEVEYPEDGGITIVKRGVVAYVQPHAGNRHILTQEGSTLAVWSPGKRDGLSFTLLDRIPNITPMLDFFEETGRL